MNTPENDFSLKTLIKKLDTTAKVSVLIAIVVIILPFFASGGLTFFWPRNVSLPTNTTWRSEKYGAEFMLSTEGSGKRFTYYTGYISGNFKIEGNKAYLTSDKSAKPVRIRVDSQDRIYIAKDKHGMFPGGRFIPNRGNIFDF